ncbi:MAG: hypothetical protein HY465_00570 [Deltaproteobacteria bacterium]|nr:hypothetical protein [Deltaproteobacteria bacterium]
MKRAFIICCALPLLASCSGQALSPAFIEPPAGSFSPSVSPAVNEELARQAGLERIVFHVGPVDLPPNTTPDAMADQPLVMRFQLEKPMWIIGFEPKVIDAHGNDLPATLLRQALMLNNHEENPLCASGGGGNPIAVATALLTDVALPDGHGYPVLPSDPLEVQVVFQNQTDKAYDSVSFEIALVAKPMNDLIDLKDVQPVFLEFDPCEHALGDIQPGEFSPRTVEAKLPEGGNLVVAHGLLGDYGVSVAITKEKELEPFWKAESELDAEHHLLGLDPNPFEDPAGVAISADAELTLSVTYDNISDRWLTAVPAGAMVYVVKE